MFNYCLRKQSYGTQMFTLSSELLHQCATRLLGFGVKDQNRFLGWSQVKMLFLKACINFYPHFYRFICTFLVKVLLDFDLSTLRIACRCAYI